MGIKALSPGATKVVKCPFDKSNPQTEFVITESLPVDKRSELSDGYTDYERKDKSLLVRHNRSQRNQQIVRYGLKAWRGFQDGSGNEVPLPIEAEGDLNVVSKVGLQMLSIKLPGMVEAGFDTLIDWLAEEIWNANKVGGDEEVPFVSQSDSTKPT